MVIRNIRLSVYTRLSVSVIKTAARNSDVDGKVWAATHYRPAAAVPRTSPAATGDRLDEDRTAAYRMRSLSVSNIFFSSTTGTFYLRVRTCVIYFIYRGRDFHFFVTIAYFSTKCIAFVSFKMI